MRFHLRKILISLIVAVGFMVIVTNLTGYGDTPVSTDGYLVYEAMVGLPDQMVVPNSGSFNERFEKYDLGNATQIPVFNIRVFQTRGYQDLGTTSNPNPNPNLNSNPDPSPSPSPEPSVASVRSWEDNEWYREQFVKRLWKGNTRNSSSIWVPTVDRVTRQVLDDRILEQMHYVSKRYRRRNRGDPKHSRTPVKTIYVPDGVDAQVPLGTLMFARERCPVRACNISTDPADENTAALRLLQIGADLSALGSKPPGQIWAIWLLESPANTGDYYGGPADLINWTATYRWDSTIVTPYAKFVPYSATNQRRRRRRGVETRGRNYAANKTKMVAWFVSNCNAQNDRLELAHRLAKHVPVDIFGGCGTLDCPRAEQTDCFDRLSADYKFYLSFENSNCDHYITEKFFENGLSNDIVPIVLGARRGDYRKAAPPHSYIDAADFSGPESLADHLLRLNASDRLYNAYFHWKGSGEFVNTKFWCRLCSLLHDEGEEEGARPDMWYTDFYKWWTHDGACYYEKSGTEQ